MPTGAGFPIRSKMALTQITAARLLLVELLEFPDPFAGERFREAKFLDVHFRSKDVLKSNGVAFDELQRFKRPTDPPDTASLCFNLATTVNPAKNLSPAHEYFHLIQYGVSYYKNSWYTEGTARWSEAGLGTGSVGGSKADAGNVDAGKLAAAEANASRPGAAWPENDEQRETLFRRRYDAAEFFWNVLAQEHDEGNGELPSSPELVQLQNMRYADGTPVLRDSRFSGHRFIRQVLLELGRADDVTFRERGYDRWSEANQFSSQNSPDILEAVRRAARLEP
ncbi:MAG: hypothetical protein QM775_33150 [Pirellulales bacterium]